MIILYVFIALVFGWGVWHMHPAPIRWEDVTQVGTCDPTRNSVMVGEDGVLYQCSELNTYTELEDKP